MAIKTSKDEVVYGNEDNLQANRASVAFSIAHNHCWRCGLKKRLDRCHIVPESKGGQDIARNFVLLCKHCHIASPDNGDYNFMWKWIEAYKVTEDFYIEQGVREFEFIYKTDIYSEINHENMSETTFKELLKAEMKEIPNHFGQPRHNASSVAGAIASVLRMETRQKSM